MTCCRAYIHPLNEYHRVSLNIGESQGVGGGRKAVNCEGNDSKSVPDGG